MLYSKEQLVLAFLIQSAIEPWANPVSPFARQRGKIWALKRSHLLDLNESYRQILLIKSIYSNILPMLMIANIVTSCFYWRSYFSRQRTFSTHSTQTGR
jgi:hypothetical protein